MTYFSILFIAFSRIIITLPGRLLGDVMSSDVKTTMNKHKEKSKADRLKILIAKQNNI